jgi:hypothetical protein
MSTKRIAILAAMLLAAISMAAWWLWFARPQAELTGPQVATATQPDPAASTAGPPRDPASGPLYPVAPDPLASPLGIADVPAALEEVFGSKAVANFLQVDDIARRMVATVDNLGRDHAPPAMWPIHPTPGRFTVAQHEGDPVISADNAGRYGPLVLLAESIDMRQAAELYLRMYPMLQHAYRGLGYPGGHFNDRLIQVIDLLLATPEREAPIRLQLTEVKGPIPSTQPWVRYEFADPALEGLSAGQKILVRVGVVNERRLKKKLAEFREEILKRAQKR